MVAITVEIPSFFLEPITVTVLCIVVVTLLLYVRSSKYGEKGRDQSSRLFEPYDESSQESDNSMIIPPRKSNSMYRMDEEIENTETPDKTITRPDLWRVRASWKLASVPPVIDDCLRGVDNTKSLLDKYQIDPITGFLPRDDPIQRLPYEKYHLWEDLADDLPKLLGARLGQAREPLRQLPVIDSTPLREHAELRRAHLILCLFAHAYIWGGKDPLDELPEGISIPLWDVSQRLGIPPVLGHPSIVMYNYRRLDHRAEICMENLSTLNNFFDGRDESWFYLITVEIEAKGAASIVPLMLTIDAIDRSKHIFAEAKKQNAQKNVNDTAATTGQEREDISDDGTDGGDDKSDSDEEWTLNSFIAKQSNRRRNRYSHFNSSEAVNQLLINAELNDDELKSMPEVINYVISQLKIVNRSISGMNESLIAMREGCHPFIFYHRVRPFLSGWKHNPTLPNGILYKGVSNERKQFYGGSAAQSSVIPMLDIALGITHDSAKSTEFLHAMRNYMMPKHRDFLSYLERIANLREFVLNCINMELDESKLLKQVYDDCVLGLQEFRTGHITLVADYILAQMKKDNDTKTGGMEKSAGGKGTGGTDLMNFLKPIRDDCSKKLIDQRRPPPNNYRAPSPLLALISPSTSSQSLNLNNNSNNSISSAIDSGNFSDDEYFKDCGDPDDIDLYRGGYSTTSSSLSKIHEFKSKGISVLESLSISKLSHIIHYSSNAYYNHVPLLTDVEYDQVKDLERKKSMMTSGKTNIPSTAVRGCMMGGNVSMPGAYGNMLKSSENKDGVNKCPFGGTGTTQTKENGRMEEPGCPYAADKINGTYQ